VPLTLNASETELYLVSSDVVDGCRVKAQFPEKHLSGVRVGVTRPLSAIWINDQFEICRVARARGHGRIESLACSQVWENAWPRTCRFFLFEVTTRYLSPSTIRLDFSIFFMRVVRLASSNIPSFTSGVCMFHAHAAPHRGGSTTPPRWQAPPLEPRRRQGSPSMSKSAGWCGKPCRACLRIRRLGTGDSKEAGGFGRIHHSSIAFGPL
jgi:hypothetical protein